MNSYNPKCVETKYVEVFLLYLYLNT